MKKIFQKNIFYSLLTITPLIATSFVFCSNFSYISKSNFNNKLNSSNQEQEFNGKVVEEDFSVKENLPSKYDPRESWQYEAKVKNQYNTPLCGAYSTSSAIEWNLIKNNINAVNVSSSDDYSINPTHLRFAYANRTSDYDKLNLIYNDVNNNLDLSIKAIFPEKLGTKFAQWVGPVYSKDSTANGQYKFDPVVAHLDRQIYTNYKEIDSIKELIKKYGSVVITYNLGSLGVGTKYTNFPKASILNHASIIIGWDDSISKDKFSNASRDGAWIVQNSWGDNAHNNGCYYASYDSYIGNIFALNFSPKENQNDEYNNNYFYDTTMSPNTNLADLNIDEYAAVFPSLKSSYNKKELLKQVGLEIVGKNVDVQVDIYKNLKDIKFGLPTSTSNNPTNGELVSRQIAKYEYPGYYALDLPNPIELEPNQNFSVVVKILKGEGTKGIKTSYEPNSYNDMTFYKDASGNWINSRNHKKNVVMIKAMTLNEDIKGYDANSALDLSYGQIKFNKHEYEYSQNFNNELNFDVYMDKTKLTKDVDYSIKSITHEMGKKGTDFIFEESIPMSNGVLTIEGKGKYKGILSKNYIITPSQIPDLLGNGTYNETSKKIDISINSDTTNYSQLKLNGNWRWRFPDKQINLNSQDDNYIEYTGNDKDYFIRTQIPVSIFVSTDGSGGIKPVDPPNPPSTVQKDISVNSTITIDSNTKYYYSGNSIEPNISVSFENSTLVANQDYKLTYENNINPGVATITINGIGNYTGQKTISFTIEKAENEITKFEFDQNNNPIGESKFGQVKFRYSKDKTFSNGVIYDKCPQEEGIYYIQAYVEGTSNYNEIVSKNVLSVKVDNNGFINNNQNDENSISQNKTNNKLSSLQIIIISASIIIVVSIISVSSFVIWKKLSKKNKLGK